MRSYRKDFFKYVSMNMMSMAAWSMYLMADTFFISKGLGANGLAALNLALPVYNLISGIGMMFGIGGAAGYIIAATTGDEALGNRIYKTVAAAGASVGLIMSAVGLFLSGRIAVLLGADSQVFDNTNIYLKIILLFAPLFILNTSTSAFVKNDGNPRLAMIGMLGGCFMNILLDYVFIFICGLGMLGAVLATGFAPVTGLITLSFHFLKKKGLLRLNGKIGSPQDLFKAVSSGFPAFVAEVSVGIVMAVFNFLILDLAGNDGVAAYGVIANVFLVVVSVYNGIAQGVQPLFGETYASKDRQGARIVFRLSIVSAVVISAVFYVLFFACRSGIVAIFNSEGNRMLQQTAEEGFVYFFSQCLFLGLNTVLIMYLVSVEREKFAQVLSLLKGLIIVIPLAVIMAGIWGIIGVWLTQTVTELIVCLLCIGGILQGQTFYKK